MSVKCYICNTELGLTPEQDASRSDECPGCFANIRCCRMCYFYDTSSYNECREPTADRIVEKEKANFCDHFKLSSSAQDLRQKKDELLSAADLLFKK